MTGREVAVADPADRYVPMKYEGKIEPNYYCRAWRSRARKYCIMRAGHGTNHPRAGRCRRHGGMTPVKSGIYSKVMHTRIRDLAEHFENIESPLDILPELAQARALYTDYINRWEDFFAALLAWHTAWQPREDSGRLFFLACAAEGESWEDEGDEERAGWRAAERRYHELVADKRKPREILDIADAYRILSEITKIVERIEKIRAIDAISRPDLHRLVQEFGRVVEAYNNEPDPKLRLEKIIEGWLRIRLP